LPKLKPLYAYFHSYEAKFGELAQIKELEKQMGESFPEDPSLSHFAARFSSDRFNPITARVIISPTAQMRPKNIMQSVEQVSASVRGSPHPSALVDRSPRPQFIQTVNSPKRPLAGDDQEEMNPPKRFARGVSPLKGAAGRRLDQQRRAAAQGQGASTHNGAPAPISRDITFLLGLIPPAYQYEAQRYKPDSLVRILRETAVPDFNDWKVTQGQASRQARQVSGEYPTYPTPTSIPTGRNSPYLRGGGDPSEGHGATAGFGAGQGQNQMVFYPPGYPYSFQQQGPQSSYPHN
jgi:cleavage stimulation factor subunit 3